MKSKVKTFDRQKMFGNIKKIMVKVSIIIMLCFFYSIRNANCQSVPAPDTLSFLSGNLHLKGLLWRPVGHGRFPAIIFCHGSYLSTDSISDPVKQVSFIGPVFARQGYIFFVPFRRGTGLSAKQGRSVADMMEEGMKSKGQDERNKVQLHALETDELNAMVSATSYLRTRKDVDTSRMGIAGHSFWGSLALLLAEKEPSAKALLVFGGAGYSWNLSPQLRTCLTGAIAKLTMPVMLIYAQNDYSTTPAYALDSIMENVRKPHDLKLYPKSGASSYEGHNIVFLNTKIWEKDVFDFLIKVLK